MAMEGMFISEYQISFENLGNRDYIFQRTSDGLVDDACLQTMLPEVKTVERRGAVHNFRPNKSWIAQVELFLRLSSGKGFKVLCGDYESGVLDRQAAIDFWCFLRELEAQRPDKKIIFYTTIYKLRDNLMIHQGVATPYGPIDWEYFDMWLAQYPIIKNADGTTRLDDGFDVQTSEPYLSISGVVVRTKPPVFWQYWADGNRKGPKYGCGSPDTNLDIFFGSEYELDEYFNIEDDPPAGDCEDQIADAVAVVASEYEKKLEHLAAVHETDLSELKKAHALTLSVSIKKAHNDALQSLIAPLLK